VEGRRRALELASVGATGFGTILFTVVSGVGVAAPSLAQSLPESVQEEIDEAILRAAPTAAAVKQDPARYLEYAQPFGPLDLDVGARLDLALLQACQAGWRGGIVAYTLELSQYRALNDRIRCGAQCFDKERRAVVPDAGGSIRIILLGSIGPPRRLNVSLRP
jgi:hypothetical protein